MNYILFDDPRIRPNLLPFTFTRPVSHLRVGILTIAEKWQRWLDSPVSCLTQPYLQKKFPLVEAEENVFINGAVCPNAALVRAIGQLGAGGQLVRKNVLVAARTRGKEARPANFYPPTADQATTAPADDPAAHFTVIANPWDIFTENGPQIRADFALITRDRTSHPVSDPHTVVYNPADVFLEAGVTVKAAVLNAERGPVYLGKNAQVMEGAVVRGPFAMGEDSIINVGGRMIGDTTIGPSCKVGGEVSNSVILGYSSKVHDGFLGNSVIGEWCNLGADTNTSNMKSDYGNAKLWNYAENRYRDTGRLFCGTMMGDHSKASINTMFNTATVIGVNVNLFGPGFPPKFVPSFSWGGGDQWETYRLDKALEVARRAMERRNVPLEMVDREILAAVYELEKRAL
ncbi:MAG: GlmU family protein [Ferruginibacter sp.]|nr:GlmU family protein [Cytophagales bacterium]